MRTTERDRRRPPLAGDPEYSTQGAELGAPIEPTPIRTILLPLDGSPLSEQAIPVALAIGRASGARVQAVHLSIPLPAGPDVSGLVTSIDAMDQDLARSASEYAERWTRRLSAEAGVVAACEAVRGARPSSPLGERASVTDALLDASERHQADLIAMTTHGLGGLSRAWLGSTADGLIRRSRAPVLAIHPSPTEHQPTRGRELPEHILVPLDGSPLSDRVLGDVVALSRLGGARVSLLTVLAPRLAIARPAPVTRTDEADLARRRDEAERHLASAAARCREQGVAARTAVVVDQHPAMAILTFGCDIGADLIAMATHGRSGVRRLMLGSVADKVLRASPVPVLVRRPTAAAGGGEAEG